MSQEIHSRELFHATCAGIKLERAPYWVMRQAGRYLPEYRKLKEKYSFLEMVKTPELAVEVALQPMKRFDFDCSIMFSDILVVAEALGFGYAFKQEGGIAMLDTANSKEKIEAIEPEKIEEKLQYVVENLKMLRKALPQKAVLGFSATPFTLAAYMVEGQSSKDFPKFKAFVQENGDLFELLMQKLSKAISIYAGMQIECGIDAFQLFDSHAGLTPKDSYRDFSGVYVAEVLESIAGKVRSIVYANSMTSRFDEIVPMGADIYSLDSSVPLSFLHNTYKGHYTLQGNLDPQILVMGTPEMVSFKTSEILKDMAGYGRHIFNLGHGITPDAKIENVEAMCQTLRDFKY